MSIDKLVEELSINKETIKEEWNKTKKSDAIQQMKSGMSEEKLDRLIYRTVKQRLQDSTEKPAEKERTQKFSVCNIFKLGLQQLGYDVSSNDRFFGNNVDLYAVQGEKEHAFWIIESESETVDPFTLAKRFDKPIHLHHIHVHGDLNVSKVSEHQFDMKRGKVLELIQKNGIVDRTTILRETNIRAGLLDRIIEELINDEKIEEEVKGAKTRGRPKKLYRANKKV